MGSGNFKLRALFNLISDTAPHNSNELEIKYRRTETNNFLNPAATPNEELSATVTFAAASPQTVPPTYLGTIEVEFMDEVGEASSDVTVTLLAGRKLYSFKSE